MTCFRTYLPGGTSILNAYDNGEAEDADTESLRVILGRSTLDARRIIDGVRRIWAHSPRGESSPSPRSRAGRAATDVSGDTISPPTSSSTTSALGCSGGPRGSCFFLVFFFFFFLFFSSSASTRMAATGADSAGASMHDDNPKQFIVAGNGGPRPLDVPGVPGLLSLRSQDQSCGSCRSEVSLGVAEARCGGLLALPPWIAC